MRAVRFHQYGGPEVLTVEDAPEPHAGPDQVRVRVGATSINPVDCKIRAGYLHDVWPANFPAIPGTDAAGVVDEVGDGVTDVTVGDDVFGLTQGGAVAEFALLSGGPLCPPAGRPSRPRRRSGIHHGHRRTDRRGAAPGETVLIEGQPGVWAQPRSRSPPPAGSR